MRVWRVEGLFVGGFEEPLAVLDDGEPGSAVLGDELEPGLPAAGGLVATSAR